MEKQLPTLRPLSKEELVARKENKQRTIESIKDNINYIYVLLIIIVNILISTCKIEDNSVKLQFPSSALSWCMWIIQMFMVTLIGVLILNAFRRQGVHNGHKMIKDTYEAYKSALNKPLKNKNPRSLKQYYRTKNAKDSLSKSVIFIILTTFTGSATIVFNLNNLLSLIANIIFAVAFGIKEMMDAETYVVTELVTWYQLETEKLNKERKDGERNMHRPRHAKSSRVQQKEESSTGQTNCESNTTDTAVVGTSSSRLPS